MNGAYWKHPAFNLAPSIENIDAGFKIMWKTHTCLSINGISNIFKTDVETLWQIIEKKF